MTTHFRTMDQVHAFLEGTEPVDFEVPSRSERLAYMAQTLAQFAYWRLGRRDKGLLGRITGYSRQQVTRLLDKLRAECTKSRPRRSNDNALVESKHGSVVRKHLGYAHIPAQGATALNAYLREHLWGYLNYHRPASFPAWRSMSKAACASATVTRTR